MPTKGMRNHPLLFILKLNNGELNNGKTLRHVKILKNN